MRKVENLCNAKVAKVGPQWEEQGWGPMMGQKWVIEVCLPYDFSIKLFLPLHGFYLRPEVVRRGSGGGGFRVKMFASRMLLC